MLIPIPILIPILILNTNTNINANTNTGEDKSTKEGILFIESSAKAGFNIKALFRKLATGINIIIIIVINIIIAIHY